MKKILVPLLIHQVVGKYSHHLVVTNEPFITVTITTYTEPYVKYCIIHFPLYSPKNMIIKMLPNNTIPFDNLKSG